MNREDFEVLKNYVYLDSSATALKPNCILNPIKKYYLENGSLQSNLEISEVQKILDLKLKNVINNILGYLIGDVVSDYLVQNNIRLEEEFYPYVFNNYHAVIKKLELE